MSSFAGGSKDRRNSNFKGLSSEGRQSQSDEGSQRSMKMMPTTLFARQATIANVD